MKHKPIFLMLVLLLGACAVCAVSGADINDTQVSSGDVDVLNDVETPKQTQSNEVINITPQIKSTQIQPSSFKTYAIDTGAGEKGNYFKYRLIDEDGNPLANKSVDIGFNGATYHRVTDSNGWAKIQINLAKSGSYTFAMGFTGDETYNGAFAIKNIVVNKKPTVLSAADKNYKVKAVKKYTVTLKTGKTSSADGKAHLKAGKVIKLTVNSKTYTAKTNSKGQAVFKLSLNKKGTFKAKIKFAGDITYKSVSKSVKIKVK